MRFKLRNLLLIFSTVCIFLNPFHISGSPLLLTCGPNTGGTDADGRKWEPDGKYLVAGDDKSTAAKAGLQDPSLPSYVPYMSARIFQSESTYQFPLQNSSSRTLLRLHFYPSPYPNVDVSKSYFSVVAGSMLLLNNFSAYITAEALSQSYLVKEYYLTPPRSASLNVTFRPADNSFAFINGVEVIAAPEIFDNEPLLVGSYIDARTFTTVPVTASSMEMSYRLNVGGQFISPMNDSDGLMRTWYDDSVYIYGAGHGVALQADTRVGYKKMPPYTAPLDVYRTYRSMGAYADVNKVSNLTWIFEIDPGFMYLVRLHWCDSEMVKVNQRVFDVMINNMTAAHEVDLFGWTNAIATPVRKDYVVITENVTGNDDTHMWVSLVPTNQTRPEFMDVLLNGLEIFKMSDNVESTLAGPNPMISDLMRKYLEGHRMGLKDFEENDSTIIITFGAGGAAAVGVATAVICVVYRRKRKATAGGDSRTSWLPISWNSNTNTTKSSTAGKNQTLVAISTDAASNCRHFSLVEVTSATDNFDESNVIGVGGFGKVYKGVIDGGTKVAIKRSNPSSGQGVNEFVTEIEMLSRLRHRHLVSLIGFCEDNGEMILVYDYMGRGTLREHLYKGNETTLSWKQRLQICIGSARGLHYLHTGAKYTIIHRDVKTTNILLDDKWVAKVSDFGLSKTGPTMDKGHVSTAVKGSFGYLDPEYFSRQQLTDKSDVYSFGVVLFEVLCARPALSPNLPQDQVSLADWAARNVRNGTVENIIDPALKGTVSPDSLAKFVEMAAKCLADHGGHRPSMGDVLWSLEMVLQLQETYESSGAMEGPEEGRSVEYDRENDGEKNETTGYEENDHTFSLYVNQEGR
ncbi:receptor-like protein kinase ANXUR2 [Salvia miltiorrhiza]|uniref:receptor-like protein kinase ANXUR2 n=1 Tax=Salvia miltiorrhiza TaxID=226208 RepID=UPI0025AC4D45|nr:receptor-like protein kinase ANXUR2 [Salvia miltiorrhiza]